MTAGITRRLFAGLAAVAPAAIAKAPAGLALGRATAALGVMPDPDRRNKNSPLGAVVRRPGIEQSIQLLWKNIDGQHRRKGMAEYVATREAAGILDPEIQALTACSPVYRMHLQMLKDERAESIIQKLRDRISELEKLTA